MTKITRRSFLSASTIAATHMLTTPSAWAEKEQKGAGFTFVQMCDTQLGMGGYEHDVETFKLAVKHINELKPQPEFVVICGDLINTPGSEKETKQFNAIKAGFQMSCYCAPGNHDLGNKTNPELLKRYRKAVGRDYYVKELPHCALIALNTQLWKSPLDAESARQNTWLDKAMLKAASANKPIVAFGHHPLFLNDPQEKEAYYNLPVESRLQLLRLFKTKGVAAYLSGHAHKNLIKSYERIQLVTSATTSRNFDNAPMGFRLWHIKPPRPYKHEYVPVKDAKPPAKKRNASAKTKPAAT